MSISFDVRRWAFGVGCLLFGLILLLPFRSADAQQQQRISEDRDLKELDLKSWDCLNRPEGTGKTPDGAERNRLKNRSIPSSLPPRIESFDTAGFLKHVSAFDSQAKFMRRKELSPAQRQQLEKLENQVVSLTAYLVIAYCGPPESTNCGSIDFHDWHLELFEQPQDHPPQVGDPTPIVCETTPRTQGALFRDGVRLQELAGFFRKPDVTVETLGQKAQKVRVTGYLLWDDDHNGKADIGSTIKVVKPNKYHQPWRSTAWEIHPILKIERADGTSPPPRVVPSPAPSASAEPSPETSPGDPATATPSATPTATITPTPTTTPPPFATITKPVKIKIPYGETTLAPGTKLPVVSRAAQTVTVKYLEGTYVIPSSSTDSP